jgi:hypothetical protein
MMTKDELWAALVERYPEFKDEEYIVKQRARGLKRILDQAWDEGHAKGLANGKALEQLRNASEAKKNPFGGLFGGL